MIAFIILVFLLFVLVSRYLVKSVIKPKNYPPGPLWFPMIGSSELYVITKTCGCQFKAFLSLAQKYSTQILGLKMAGENVVVIFGEENVHKALYSADFDGRPDNFFWRLRCLGKRLGITFTDGLHWKIHRRFTQTELMNAGFGKALMETEIQNTLLDMVEKLQGSTSPVDPNQYVSLAVFNVLWKIIAGETISNDRWSVMQDLFKQRARAFSLTGGILNRLPWCRFIAPVMSGYSIIADLNRKIAETIEEAIARHKKFETEGKDFMYAFMEKINQGVPSFTEDQLKVVCLDLIVAVSQTSNSAVLFALIQVLRDRAMQDRIHQEIDQVLGEDMPCWADNHRLPYTAAFLQESLRYYTIAPLAGPRRILRETVLDGYTIPKDTTVLISLGDIHSDPQYWEEPHVFKPERFIENGKFKMSTEHFYPFGLGRRRCPGDPLARAFIFITFVGLLQRYLLTCEVMPSPDPEPGMLQAPKPFTAVFTKRKI